MARKIVVDPSRLNTASQQMEQKAADYEREYKRLFAEVEKLGVAWKGKDNVAFVDQIRGFTDDFERMTQLMREYSNFLRISAENYKATQEEITMSARRLVN